MLGASRSATTSRVDGIPYWRSDLLLWLAIGLLAWSIGKRNVLTVVVDFVPFAAVLIVYDYLRGISDTLGMPTWWHPQIDVDKFLFFGTEPTVWLQEHLQVPARAVVGRARRARATSRSSSCPTSPPPCCGCAAARDFYRWTLRFVAAVVPRVRASSR